MSIRLFPFQEEAAAQLTEAADDWISEYAINGVRKLGLTPIPFIGHLKAVTGAGKTPILAKTASSFENAVVLWTSVSAAVVDQTFRNLSTKYRSLLPQDVQILRERPSKSEWEQLTLSTTGLTIWVTTVGSWNEVDAAESGSENARLNMHRPQADWGGEKSPWKQLATDLVRPVWVVYDESHNQTPAQLDQLLGLRPAGFLLASATPPSSDRFEQLLKATASDDAMRPIAERARVRVSTRDVVEAQLLKHTIEVENFDSDPEALLEAAVDKHRDLEHAALGSQTSVHPKALYVVESSNPRRGEVVSRPVAIWEYLVGRGVSPTEIAVYTQTKIVPDEAERVSSLSELAPRHTHIICNRSLQEGWDDPEAYIEYFDDESNSYTRIAQVIGRALRQPFASHFDDESLNTAYLYIRVQNKAFEKIIDGLKKELSLYALDEDDPYGSAPVRIKTRKEPLPPIEVRSELEGALRLPNYQLGEADLDNEIRKIKTQATQRWTDEDLVAPGLRTTKRISLLSGDDDTRYKAIAVASRRANGEFLRRRIQAGNRHCAHLIEPDVFTGPAFEQRSSRGSLAQDILSERATAVIDQFERSVQLVQVEITGEEYWHLPHHYPRGVDYKTFRNSAHRKYDLGSFDSADERECADVLDSLDTGVWARNPAQGAGYGIQLPIKVGTSNTFYPDFLWWIGNMCYALDPTGAHILEGKVRGKLMTINEPRIVLLTRGAVSRDFAEIEKDSGWTMVRPMQGRSAAPELFPDLRTALLKLVKEATR